MFLSCRDKKLYIYWGYAFSFSPTIRNKTKIMKMKKLLTNKLWSCSCINLHLVLRMEITIGGEKSNKNCRSDNKTKLPQKRAKIAFRISKCKPRYLFSVLSLPVLFSGFFCIASTTDSVTKQIFFYTIIIKS